LFPALTNDLVNLYAKIFSSRYQGGEAFIIIQIYLVEPIQYFPLRQSIELRQIHHHTRARIDGAGDGNLHMVVMAVAARVITLAVNEYVLSILQRRIMQAMRSGKPIAAREMNFVQAKSVLRPEVVGEQVGRFVQPNAVQFAEFQAWREHAPNLYGDVFSGGNQVTKNRHFLI